MVLRSRQTRDERAFNSFWAPIMSTSKVPIVYIGANYSYRFSTAFLDNYRLEHHVSNTGPEFFIDLKKGKTVDESDLIPTDRLIGFGDVAAAARVISTLTHLGKKYDLRYGNDITVTDLHSSPTILIGGFSNTWTLQMTRDLRYTLEQGDRIVDRQQKNEVWIVTAGPDGHKQDDYAVISRIPNSETGNFTLAIAGIDTYSNQAAADFISDPEKIGALVRSWPDGWEKKNLQMVLHTRIVNEIPVSVDIKAVHSW